MLKYSVLRYGTDIFTFGKKVLATSKVAFDLSDYDKIDSMTISGNEPLDSNRGIVFYCDGNHCKINTDGTTSAIAIGESVAENAKAILFEGNTPAQLNALTDVTAFAGKRIYPYVALSKSESGSAPSVKIAMRVSKTVTVLTKVHDFASKTFDKTIRLTSVTPNISKSGNASATLYAKLLVDGSWTDFVPIANALNCRCMGYQLRAALAVNTVNSDSIAINNIAVQLIKGGL